MNELDKERASRMIGFVWTLVKEMAVIVWNALLSIKPWTSRLSWDVNREICEHEKQCIEEFDRGIKKRRT